MPDYVPSFERVLTAIRLEEPDRVPNAELWVDPEVKSAFLGRPIASLEDDVDFWRAANYDYITLEADLYAAPQIQRGIATQSCNNAVTYDEHRQNREWVATEARAITTWEEIQSFPWPTADDVGLDHLRQVRSYMPSTMGVLVTTGHVFTATWQLMGFETFCLAVLEELDLVCDIMRRLGEETLLLLDRVLSHDVVGVVCFQDDFAYSSGPMISPQLLRQVFFPWLERAATKCHDAGRPMLLHSDGKLDALLPDIVASGADGIQAIEPKCMDIAAVKREYGDRLALMGNVDLGYTLTRGTPHEVMDEVRRIIHHAAPGGGLLVGSANSITNYVPLENYRALLGAVREYGRYPLTV